MSYVPSPEMLLRTLTEPRRNNYFYGKMLDVPQLRLEQDYGKKKQWLMNRLSLGAGVLCGLGVTLVNGKLRVDQGVAIDPLGREIIVPGSFTIDPFSPKPPCERGWKGPAHDPAAPPTGPATLWVCYNECLADQVPSAISDCHGQDRREAGTIVESFKFRITEGAVEGPAFSSAFCVPIHEIFKTKPEGDGGQKPLDPHAALCELLGNDCSVVDGPVCVPIATFSYKGPNEIGDLKVCEARNRVYSNQVLLELILCLMARVEECCGKGPAVDETLKVTGIEFSNGGMSKAMATADLHNDRIGMVLPADFQALEMRVSFNKPVQRESVTMGTDPQDIVKASFIIEKIKLNPVGFEITDVITGSLGFDNGDKDVTLKFAQGALQPGLYFGQFNGTPDPAHARPAIVDAVQSEELDAESTAFPSGDGNKGGSFDFFFTVEREAVVDTLRVTEVEFTSAGAFAPQRLTDADLANGRIGMVLPINFDPVVLKITFNKPVDRQSVSLNTDFAGRAKHNFQFDRVLFERGAGMPFQYNEPLSGGGLQFDNGDTVVMLKFNPGAMRPGHFLGRLYGDADPRAERPAIVDAAERRGLDGEPDALPSGRGDDGGLFTFWVTLDQPLADTLRVTGVEFAPALGAPAPRPLTTSDLNNGIGMVIDEGFDPVTMTVSFNKPVSAENLRLAQSMADIDRASFLMVKHKFTPTGTQILDVIGGTLDLDATRQQATHKFQHGVLTPGLYLVQLYGDEDAQHGRPAIVDEAFDFRLDGEPDALPSGRGDEGGMFQFGFEVKGEAAVEDTLRVKGVSFASRSGAPERQMTSADLQNGRVGLLLPEGFGPLSMTIDFNKPYDQESVSFAGTIPEIETTSICFESVRLQAVGFTITGVVNGVVGMSGNSVTLQFEPGPLRPGTYFVQLNGFEDPRRPAIVDAARLQRLDGEPDTLPSGRGDPGGSFSFFVTVEGEVEETLRVVAVETLRRTDGSEPHLARPADGLEWRFAWEPNGVRVRFNKPVDRESFVLPPESAALDAASILFARSRNGANLDAALTCRISFEDEQTVLLEIRDTGELAAGKYLVVLRGDPGDRHPPITTRDRRSRLDGEPNALPSGDGAEGGTFQFPIVLRR